MIPPPWPLPLLLSVVQAALPGGTRPESVPLVQRIVVLGASVSHGFGLDAEVEARVSLADVIDATLLVDHEPVRSRTSLFFFADPRGASRGLVEQARADDPSLLFAIDYLFWFGYGLLPSDEARLALLDEGLASLEGFSCPLILGDLPDMTSAARAPPAGGLPPLLGPGQVPSTSCLAKLNRRVREWAGIRRRVVVVPLAELIARLEGGREIVIRGNRWSEGARERFLGPDRLHPKLEGAVALWLAGLDGLAASVGDFSEPAFDWSVESVRTRVLDVKAPEREARRAKARKREERSVQR